MDTANNELVCEPLLDFVEEPAIRRGLCLVLVGPSGSGKTTVMRKLISLDAGLRESVSVTTRPPRAGERDGVDYHFVTAHEFRELLAVDGMLESTDYAGQHYGTLRGATEVLLSAGVDVGFVLDADGAHRLARALPGDVVSVFIQPPSMDEVRRRMLARGDMPQAVERRMETDYCIMTAMRGRQACEHTVVNDNLDDAVRRVSSILKRSRGARMDPAVRMAGLDALAAMSEECDF